MSAASYYIKIKDLWDDLEMHRTPCSNDKGHKEEREIDKLMQFLMGLNDSYNVIQSNILIMNPLPNVRQAHSLIIQEETQQHMVSESGESFSITTAINNRLTGWKSSKGKNCDHCNKLGNIIEECRTLKFHYTFCDKRGPTKDRCRIKNGTWNNNNCISQ